MGALKDVIDIAVGIAEKALDAAEKEGGKTIFAEALKRVLPTARQKLIEQLFTKFAEIFTTEYGDHADLVGSAEDELRKALTTFLSNGGVRDLLIEPLDPKVTSVNYRYLEAAWTELELMSLPSSFGWGTASQRYLNQIRKTIQTNAELRDQWKVGMIEEIRDHLSRTAPVDPGFRLELYRARIKERYGLLKFDSFHVTGSEVGSIRLREVFVQPDAKEDLPPLNIPKHELVRLAEEGQIDRRTAVALDRANKSESFRQRYLEAPARNIFELLRRERYSVVIGDPGSGKSSLLQELLLDWAEDPKAHPFPLLVELRQCALDEGQWHGDFCEYFATSNDSLFKFNTQDLTAYLTANDSVFLVDGLDEVFDPNQRQLLAQRVLAFQSRFPRSRIIVTSRIYGFQKDAWTNSAFRILTLQDFTLKQMQLFLNRWHEQAYPKHPDEIMRLKPRLKVAITEYAPIRLLAGNPLLLTMMAVINRMEPIPRDRRVLYERCAELLVHRWEVTAGRMVAPGQADAPGALRAPLDLEDKKTLLEVLAHEMQNTTGNLISERRLKELIVQFFQQNFFAEPAEDTRTIIEHLRGRNFVLCSAGGARYAFVHRTFLEYFAARYYSSRLDGTQVLEEVVRSHWEDERWHEVIRLVVSEKEKQPEAVRAVIRFLLEQNTYRATAANLFLAADCLSDLRNPAALGSERQLILGALRQCLRITLALSIFDSESTGIERRLRSQAVSRIASVGGQRAIQELISSRKFDWTVRAPAVQELARGWPQHPDTLRQLKDITQSVEVRQVRVAALREIARGWPQDPETFYWLRDEAKYSADSGIRYCALQELARGWHQGADTPLLLKDAIESHVNRLEGMVALQELARGWPQDPDILPLLLDRIRFSNDSLVRRVALRELARGWSQNPETLILLKECAISDEDAYMRAVSLQELGRIAHQDPDLLPLLKERAGSEDSTEVRSAAVQALARSWPQDQEMRVWLSGRAHSDKDLNVRMTAVQELSRGWPEDPEVPTLLCSLAESGVDDAIRKTALRDLAREFPQDPNTLQLLQHHVCSDAGTDSRQAAVRELALGWSQHPDTVSLLQHLLQFDMDSKVRLVSVKELARRLWWEPRTLPLLKERAHSDGDKDVRTVAMQEVARGWPQDIDTLSWLKDCAQFSVDSNLRRVAVLELALGWSQDPDTLQWLKVRAGSDEHNIVRIAALEEVVQGWSQDPDTPLWLRQRAVSDESKGMRKAALEALAHGWPKDNDILLLLKDRADSDQDNSLRVMAVQALAKGWQEDPATLDWLKEHARSHTNWAVRRAALGEVAQRWTHDPDTFALLKDRVQSDQHWSVRALALQKLTIGWSRNHDTLLLLKDRANSDAIGGVRKVALQALARNWPEDSDTKHSLSKHAGSDVSPLVRSSALQELAREWPEDPDTFRLLMDHARSDESPLVRKAALRELAREWLNNPGTLLLLEELAQNDSSEDVQSAARKELQRL